MGSCWPHPSGWGWKGLSEALLDSPVLQCFSFFFFCPYLHSLTLTFLLALPPTQYEGSRLNEEVSEGEEGTLCSVCFFPSFLACKRGGGFQMKGHNPTPATHDFQSLNCWGQPLHTRTSLPPPVWCVLTCLFLMPCLVCVLDKCACCVNPVSRFPTFDASSVCAPARTGRDASIWGRSTAFHTD